MTSQTNKLMTSQTNKLINSQTHKLTNSQSYDIFYKTHLVWHSILEKIETEKHVFSRFS